MSFGDSMKKLIGIEVVEEDEIITDAEVNAAKESISKEKHKSLATERSERTQMSNKKSVENRFSVANTGSFKLVVIEPKAFDECPKLVDSLKGRRPVIINLEKLETEEARKIFDFLSGATYALNGNVQKVANNIFIFAPENVDIAASQSQSERTFDFGKAEEKSPWR